MRNFFIFLFGFFYFTAISQNACIDALYLIDKVDIYGQNLVILNPNKNRSKVFKILDKYYEPFQQNTEKEIAQAFVSNPFFRIYSDNKTSLKGEDYNNADNEEKLFFYDVTYKNTPLSSLSPKKRHENFSNIFLSSLGFLKEKVTFNQKNILFISNLKKEFLTDSSLRFFFPTTFKVFDIIGDDLTDLPLYFNNLRIAFHEDFTNMNYSLQQFFEDKHFIELVNSEIGTSAENEKVVRLIKISLDVSKYLSNTNPPSAFNLIQHNTNLDSTMRELFQVVSIFSTSLESDVSKKLWVNETQVGELLNSKNGYDVYMGLLYRYAEERGVSEKVLSTFKNYVAKNKTELIRQIHTIIQYSLATEQIYNEIINNNTEEGLRNIEKNKEYNRRIISLLKIYIRFGQTFLEINDKADVENYILIQSDIRDINVCVNSQDYRRAITLLSIFFNNSGIKQPDLLNFSRILMKYGDFMVSVIEAQTPEDINNSFEIHTTGATRRVAKSEKIKSSTSIDTYGGLFYSPFFLGNSQFKTSFGTTIAVGPNFLLRKNKSALKKPYTSIFFPLLDLNLLGYYHISRDTIANAELSLRNVFQPGIMLSFNKVFGVFALQIGLQKAPIDFTSISTTTNTTFTDRTWRFKVNIAYNIPLYTIYVKK